MIELNLKNLSVVCDFDVSSNTEFITPTLFRKEGKIVRNRVF